MKFLVVWYHEVVDVDVDVEDDVEVDSDVVKIDEKEEEEEGIYRIYLNPIDFH